MPQNTEIFQNYFTQKSLRKDNLWMWKELESKSPRLAMERSHTLTLKIEGTRKENGDLRAQWKVSLEECHRTGDVVTDGARARATAPGQASSEEGRPELPSSQPPLFVSTSHWLNLNGGRPSKVNLPGHRIGLQQTKNGFGSMNVWGFNTVWKGA